MNGDDLKTLSDSLAESLEADGKPLQVIMLKLNLLVSRLQSEQMANNLVRQKVDNHELHLHGDRERPDRNPGLIQRVSDMETGQKRTRRAAWLALTTTVPLAAEYVWKKLTRQTP